MNFWMNNSPKAKVNGCEKIVAKLAAIFLEKEYMFRAIFTIFIQSICAIRHNS